MNKLFTGAVLATIAAAVTMNQQVTNVLAEQDATSLSCYRQATNRGVGTIPNQCPSGYESDGALFCNKTCNSGYELFGLLCEQLCPSGFAELGTECVKPSRPRPTGRHWWGGIYFKSCSSGWDEFGVACLKDCPSGWSDHTTSCGTRSSYTNGLPEPKSCPSDKSSEDGLCYSECPADTEGFMTMCMEECPTGTSKCGEGLCLDDNEDCTGTIIDIAITAA